MRRSLVLLAAVVFAFTLSAEVELPKADEKWLTLETDGFRFISNASPRVTQGIARDLLRMRAAVGQLTRFRVYTAEPTRVYLFSSERAFAPYRSAVLDVDNGYFSGFFLRRRGGNFILLRSDAASDDRVVYHELTHQFVANTGGNMPAWFNEGIAEYYSTFRTEGEAAQIGRPVGDHVLWLREQPLIPLRELFAVTRASPIYNEEERTGHFYAQSWALVHYLMSDPGRRASLGRFLTLLGSGKSVDEAFSGAFGMQVSELEEALRAYIRRVSFPYTSFELGELEIAELPEPAAMPHDAVLQQLGQLLLASADKHATSAKRFFDEALAVNPKNALAYTGLGRVYDITGRTADADAAYAKAVQIGSGDAEVYLAAGLSLMARRPDEESYRRAGAFFRLATKADPKSSRAWAALGSTLLGRNRDRPAAIAAFQKSVELEPANDEAASQLARLLAREGRHDDARKLAQARLARTHERSVHSEGTVMLAEVDRFETATEFSASLHEAIAKADAGKYDEALAILDRLLPTIRDPAIEEQTLAFREQVAGMKAKKK
ncbi:MAG TPA: tetratricopeptide repeat protein [Thermoanaerobaculia bacterium]